jgi:thioredoxin-related protein
MRRWICAGLFALLLPAIGAAQVASPHAIDIPKWFSETFLDFREDVREAAKDGKRLMAYFGQDGCPYCKALMQTNFSQQPIVEKTRKHFVAVAFNMWGDREVVWLDGATMSEKELARRLKVQFTPTVLFFDEQGKVVARINGYYAPARFGAVLDYVSGKMEGKFSLSDYLRVNVREEASATLHDEPFFRRPPYELRRTAGSRPLAVLFETPHCAPCDELHRSGFKNAEVLRLIGRFDIVRLALSESTPVVTPDGETLTAEAWARRLSIAYTPSIVFFVGPREVFRAEAYLREFHLTAALDYVASGAYRAEPSFQRFVQARAERLRKKGVRVELW